MMLSDMAKMLINHIANHGDCEFRVWDKVNSKAISVQEDMIDSRHDIFDIEVECEFECAECGQ